MKPPETFITDGEDSIDMSSTARQTPTALEMAPYSLNLRDT